MYHKLVDEREYSKIFQIINLCLCESYTDTLNLLRCKKKKQMGYRKHVKTEEVGIIVTDVCIGI